MFTIGVGNKTKSVYNILTRWKAPKVKLFMLVISCIFSIFTRKYIKHRTWLFSENKK